MRELGFAFVGAVALIALGVCAARKPESADAWSKGSAYNAPVASHAGTPETAVER